MNTLINPPKAEAHKMELSPQLGSSCCQVALHMVKAHQLQDLLELWIRREGEST